MESLEIPHEDNIYYLQVLKLDKSGFIYISDSQKRLDNVNIVMQNRFEDLPSIVDVLGQSDCDLPFLRRLSRKFGMLSFSINCPVPSTLYPLLEQEIAKVLSN